MGNTPPSSALARTAAEDAGDMSVSSPTTISSEIGGGTSRLLGGNDSSRTEASEIDYGDNKWNLRWSDLDVTASDAPIAKSTFCKVEACVFNGERRVVKTPSSPSGVEYLSKEIKNMMRLENHPHMCAAYGAGGWQHDGDMPFLVLERLDDKNLAQTCGLDLYDASVRAKYKQGKLRAKIPFRTRLDFGLQLAELLRYLHNESIPGGFVIHRDLKPSNMGISENGVLKVFDFGLAKVFEQRFSDADRYMMTGQTGGQRFMAPEVFNGMPYNETVDIYSFGMILWELCTLRKAFAGMSLYEHANKVIRDGRRPTLDKRWPQPLRDLMECCWHEKMNQRPGASEVVGILSGIIGVINTARGANFDKL